MRRYFSSLFTVLVTGASVLPSHAENKVSIQQIGAGNRVEILQKSSDGEESTLIEQNVTDDYGNQALVIQQGKTNITDLTQQGRLNNVLTTGRVKPPGESYEADAYSAAAKKARVETEAEAKRPYPERITLWLSRFRTYPDIPASPGEYTALLRIVIDRSGTARMVSIEKSSGISSVDTAALASARNVSPYPTPPEDYMPGEALLAYQVPITYKTHKDKDDF